MRFLSPLELRALDERAADALLEGEECVVAAAEEEPQGTTLVAFLRADYAALAQNAVIHLDSPAAGAAAEARGASVPEGRLAATEALALGVCDEIFDGDAQKWFERWLGSRDPAALDAAALLIRDRGGDAKEREVFARLFATGVPQRGLRAFLARKR